MLQSHLFRGDPKLEAAAVSDPAHITQGAIGPHVRKIQEALIKLGGHIDREELLAERYGPSTARAVLHYKQKRRIINYSYQTSADDMVGRMTMAAFDREVSNLEQNEIELEIDGPYFLPPQPAPLPILLQPTFASIAPVSFCSQQTRQRPRPAPRVTVLAITNTPEMPRISFRCNVFGADPATVARTTFHWELRINFDASHCPRGPSRQINMTHHQAVLGDNLIPVFPTFRGGNLTASVRATIRGRLRTVRLSHVQIAGTNPSRADLFAALPHDTLRRICLQESGGGRQFAARPDGGVSGCPLWSGDGLGGVGLFQITNPRPSDDEVWNWRANVAGGIGIFNSKVGLARAYPERVRRSAGFRRLVDAFNAHRRHTHAEPPLTITLPDFSTGDLITTCQLELDAIRGFNGWAGNDGLGHELHEFRVARDNHGRLRVQNIDEQHRTGTAVWERVPVADRPQTTGDPDYVAHVLGQQV